MQGNYLVPWKPQNHFSFKVVVVVFVVIVVVVFFIVVAVVVSAQADSYVPLKTFMILHFLMISTIIITSF